MKLEHISSIALSVVPEFQNPFKEYLYICLLTYEKVGVPSARLEQYQKQSLFDMLHIFRAMMGHEHR